MVSVTMSVDNFGRHEGIFQHRRVRDPPGEGFSLTVKGRYDMKNRQVRNMGEPKAGKMWLRYTIFKKKTV